MFPATMSIAYRGMALRSVNLCSILCSFVAFLVPVASTWINVASESSGATCASSSIFVNFGLSLSCEEAIDGLLGMVSSWTPAREDTNPWIQINFTSSYALASGRIMQGVEPHRQVKEISMAFSDGTRKELTLSRHNGTHMKDYGASWWDDLTVEGIVTSSFRIDILSHVAGEDIKVIEIELYVGHDPCPPAFKWNSQVRWCFYYDYRHSLTREETKQFCLDRGGDLLTLETTQMLNIFLGYRETTHAATTMDLRLWTSAHRDNGNTDWTWPNGESVIHPIDPNAPNLAYLFLSPVGSPLFNSSDGSLALFPWCGARE